MSDSCGLSTDVTPIVCFVGRSGAGKTTVLERVVAELKRRGLRVGVIKHDAHDFDMDRPGKDTWRFSQAGSELILARAGILHLVQGAEGGPASAAVYPLE